MAIYDAGTASLSADGTVTGVGTTWRQPLTLIRVGATMIFNTTPASIVTIAEIISDTEISVFNDKGFTAPAGTQYSILAHDGITVQGLAQDVAETLRYYQSRETEVATAVDAFNNFDQQKFADDIQTVNNQFQQVSIDAAQVSSDMASAEASAASALSSSNSAGTYASQAKSAAESVSGALIGSFQGGVTLESAAQQILDIGDEYAQVYVWGGDFPKVVDPGSTPESTGGIGEGAWVIVGDVALRTSLASADNGAGDALLAVKQPIASSVARTQHDYNLDRVSVKDWGAKGNGVTDDSAAINAACAALKGTFRELFFPAGNYVYNGTGMTIDNFVIKGEGQRTQINASANINTGWLINLLGFSARAESFYIVGNPSNINFKGIKSLYNADNGGVTDLLVENFTYGLDIDRTWYSTYENIRFRKTVPLTGADIRIGFNNPDEEVNNLIFKDIWMGEQQTNAVAIYSRTQVLTWLGCSFETKGGPRIKFFTTAYSNTFQLNGCYIEGDIANQGDAYLVEGQTTTQHIIVNDSMFRLGNTTGTLGKNVTIYMNGGWSNSPSVNLYGGNTKIWATNYQYSVGGFLNGPDYANSGDYNGEQTHSAEIYLDPRPMDVRDWNSIIPQMVNYKSHTSTSAVGVFKVYVPAGSGSPRMMQLEINALTKSVSETYVVGNEKYLIAITLPEASAAGSGTLVTKVASGASSGATLLADPSFSVLSNGYDPDTDSFAYTIYHAVSNATRLGNTLYTIEGSYVEAGLSTKTRRWKIQRL